MCSILCIFDIRRRSDELRETAVRCSGLMKHRGPDWAGVWSDDRAVLAHQRLAIVDVDTGAQPLKSPSGRQILAVNGEIYNHKDLEEGLEASYEFQTKSDCEVILPLYMERGTGFLDDLRGMFAFALYDADEDRYLIARDPIGIIPLYLGRDEEGNLFVSSEMKGLISCCRTIEEFPPGHLLDSRVGKPQAYYTRDWFDHDEDRRPVSDPGALRPAFEESVRSHLMSDVPYGILLSGGLDSSLVSAIAQEFAATRVEDDGRSGAWWPQLHSFAIGLEGSPDLINAKSAADAIGSIHHEMHFTVQEGIDALREVVYSIETFDVTTVRASTPMWLMARKIRAMGIKMVLSGEGADEMFGGYLYFHKAPDARAFHEETVRKLRQLHKFDCLRANKSMAAWGVEARVPFLDKPFLDLVMRLDPERKMCRDGRMEKHVLREAFAGLIPDEILWRQKEQFSDGVGYSWIDSLKDYADAKVSDEKMNDASHRFLINPPLTKEAYLYRQIFDDLFPHPDAVKAIPEGKSIACSSPVALEWDRQFEAMADPSGRAVRKVHRDSY